jgi:DNA polymerase-3 subunit delta'
MFDESILGHTAIRHRLLERVNSNKLFGSLLFAGPDAIGKRRVALELAQREICFKRTTCGVCGGCTFFKTDPLPKEFPNLLRIAPEGKAGLIKIDVIRGDDLIEGGVIHWAHQAAPPRCHRWIVIEDAHRLGKSSANILLKTLEEPPPGTFFILLTHKPESVLPTIRSRSERISFGSLSADETRQIALVNGWEQLELDTWAVVSNGTLKYLDRNTYDRACSQIDAWLSILEGTPFKEASVSLLPDKSSELAQSQQVTLALEQLLIVLDDYVRIVHGLPSRISPWASRLGALINRQIDVQNGYKCTLDAMRDLPRNIVPETILRKICMALRA